MSSTYPNSYYAATAKGVPALTRLEEDITCDVCIIGAGYTGLSAALHLAEAVLSPVQVRALRVLEAFSRVGPDPSAYRGAAKVDVGFVRPGELDFLGAEWPELRAFLVAQTADG